jgi:hypothetical protein
MSFSENIQGLQDELDIARAELMCADEEEAKNVQRKIRALLDFIFYLEDYEEK